MGSQTSAEIEIESSNAREERPYQIPRKDPRHIPKQIGYIQEVVSDNTRQFRRNSPYKEDNERRHHHIHKNHYERPEIENHNKHHYQDDIGYDYRPSNIECTEETRGPYKVYTYYEPVIQYQKVLKKRPNKGLNRPNSIDRISFSRPNEEEIEMEKMIRKKRQESNYNKTHYLHASCKNDGAKYKEYMQLENPECKDFDFERAHNPIYSKHKSNVSKAIKGRPINETREIKKHYPPHYYQQPRESEEISYDFGDREYYKPYNKQYSNSKGVITQDPRMKMFKKEYSNELSNFSHEDYLKAGYPTNEEMIKREWIEPINIDHQKFEKRMNYNHY